MVWAAVRVQQIGARVGVVIALAWDVGAGVPMLPQCEGYPVGAPLMEVVCTAHDCWHGKRYEAAGGVGPCVQLGGHATPVQCQVVMPRVKIRAAQ